MADFESYVSPKATGATKENLDPKLNLLAQMATPAYSSMGRGTCTNRYPDLIERDLVAAGENSIAENAAFASETTDGGTASRVNGGVRRSFNTQIFRKGYEVSGTEQATQSVTYEGKKRLAELRAIHGMELKRDVEWALVASKTGATGNYTGAAASAGTQASPTRYITDMWNQMDSSVSYTPADASDNAAAGTFLEDAINEVAEDLLLSGGMTYKMGNSFVKDANILLMSPSKKKLFDRRLDAKQSTYRQTNSGSMLGVDVTKYGTSFGDVMVTPDIHCDTTQVAVFNPMNWKWVTLRPTHEQEIAKIGDGERRQLIMEGTVIHRHTKASGRIVGLEES